MRRGVPGGAIGGLGADHFGCVGRLGKVAALVEHPFERAGLLALPHGREPPVRRAVFPAAAGDRIGPVAAHPHRMGLPRKPGGSFGPALEEILQPHRLGCEQLGPGGGCGAEGVPLALVARQPGKGQLGGDHFAGVGKDHRCGAARRHRAKPAAAVLGRSGPRQQGRRQRRRDRQRAPGRPEAQITPSASASPSWAWAATSALRSRTAMVIGPTPPGTGVMEPAT